MWYVRVPWVEPTLGKCGCAASVWAISLAARLACSQASSGRTAGLAAGRQLGQQKGSEPGPRLGRHACIGHACETHHLCACKLGCSRVAVVAAAAAAAGHPPTLI
eukprot:365508-Chlamydomonas_euryale.AAC.1